MFIITHQWISAPRASAAFFLKGSFKVAVIHGWRASIKTTTTFRPEKTCVKKGPSGTHRLHQRGETGRKMNVQGLWSGSRLSYPTFRRLEDGEDITVLLMKTAGFLGQFFWNLLCGLADRSSLLFRLVQKALIMPLEIAEPAECVILVLALSFLLCLQAESF